MDKHIPFLIVALTLLVKIVSYIFDFFFNLNRSLHVQRKKNSERTDIKVKKLLLCDLKIRDVFKFLG